MRDTKTEDLIGRDALRAKYLAERDKRLRADGIDQYLEPTGRFSYLLDDPYTMRAERDPNFDEVTVAVIGAGWSGLVTGARLKQAGIDDVRLIEAGQRWRYLVLEPLPRSNVRHRSDGLPPTSRGDRAHAVG